MMLPYDVFQWNGNGRSSRLLVSQQPGARWFEHEFVEVRKEPLNHSDEVYLNQLKRATKLLNRELDLFEKSKPSLCILACSI